MKSVYDTIIACRNDSSRNKKIEILKSQAGNELLKKYLRITYENRINFYMKNVQTNAMELSDLHSASFDESRMDDILKYIAGRILTGSAAKTYVTDLHDSFSHEWEKELLRLMINRDVQAGFSASTINKIWPGLVTQMPYMRCLSANWELTCEDGLKRTISDIVDNKYKGKILSYDKNTGKEIFQSINKSFDNGYSEDWVTITYEEDGIIKKTEPLIKEHILFLENGKEIKAGDLKSGDLLF